MAERQPDAFILERDDEAERQQEDDRLDEVLRRLAAIEDGLLDRKVA